VAAALLHLPALAAAAELRVQAAGATEATLRDVLPLFERATGHTVVAAYGAVGELRDRLQAGTPADLVIATPAILEQLERAGLVRPGARQDLGRVGGGVAVCAGAPRPSIATPAELKAALLAAREIHYADPARATAGAHFLKVVDRLGIGAEARAKGRTAPGGKAAMQAMARSCDGALGLTQVSEILSVPEVVLVGPYPGDLQSDTVYTGALLAATKERAAAGELLRFLAGPQTQARLARSGFEPVR
jgi:molybdate transport system substrate-binding protein